MVNTWVQKISNVYLPVQSKTDTIAPATTPFVGRRCGCGPKAHRVTEFSYTWDQSNQRSELRNVYGLLQADWLLARGREPSPSRSSRSHVDVVEAAAVVAVSPAEAAQGSSALLKWALKLSNSTNAAASQRRLRRSRVSSAKEPSVSAAASTSTALFFLHAMHTNSLDCSAALVEVYCIGGMRVCMCEWVSEWVRQKWRGVKRVLSVTHR